MVSRAKAFGEPPIDRDKKLAGLLALALLHPQPREAGGSAQLKQFCGLRAGEPKRLPEFRLHVSGIGKRLAAQPMQLSDEPGVARASQQV